MKGSAGRREPDEDYQLLFLLLLVKAVKYVTACTLCQAKANASMQLTRLKRSY